MDILFKGKKVGEFAETTHKFTDLEGNRILGVTSITGLVDKSNQLIYWATKLMGRYLLENYDGKTIDEQIVLTAQKKWREAKEEAADIGKEIHSFIEAKFKGESPVIPEREQTLNGVNAYLKWMKTHKIKVAEAERIIYSKKYGYAGICDWYGEEGLDLVIGDNKSSKGIYPEMLLQLSAYWKALEEDLQQRFKKGYVVKFNKETGEFNPATDVVEISAKENDKNFQAFLGLFEAKKRLNELEKPYVPNSKKV